jgi:hypothetical protein
MAFDGEARKAAAALLDEFPMFPCAFKAVRSEIELRRSMGKTIDKNEILGAIRSAREETRRVARKELFLRLGSDAERALIRHLKDVASPFAFDAAAIAARTGLDAKEAEEAAKELQRRHLLRPAGEGQYEIDSWWKAVLSET